MCGSAAEPAAFDLSGTRGLVPVPGAEAEPVTASNSDTGGGVSNGSLSSTIATDFLVTGMTCGHCVSSVKEEVGAIDGVNGVEVVLKKGGASRVTVTAAGPIDTDAVRSAVEEAGYQLA